MQQQLQTQNSEIAALQTVTQADVDELFKDEANAHANAKWLAKELTDHSREWTRIESEKSEINGKTSCPYCGAVGEGWKALRLAEIASAIAGLSAKRDELDRTHKEAEAAAKTSLDRRSAKQRVLIERDSLSKDLRLAEFNVGAVDLALASLEGKTSERDNIPIFNPVLAERLVACDAELRVKEERASNLEAERRALLGRQHDLQRLAEGEKARDQARTEEKIAKAATEAFRELKEKMVADAFAPILSVANSFCGALMKTPLAYNPNKAAIGTWRDGVWVGHKTLSGVERLMAFAGIQAAFSSRAVVRVMILDEMLRAKGKVFDDLLGACKRAVGAGTIETFVGLIAGFPEEYSGQIGCEENCQIVAIS